MVAVMIALYVVADGFDFGAGALHLHVARTDAERRQVMGAIGPWWDGNEVWLIAAGGSLLVAFPKVLAAGFSGFYLALFLVLWTLILRGVSLELRSHVDDALWRAFWDFGFAAASVLMPVLLGAALGNVLRGVPLGADGWFQLPLFTSFSPRGTLGLLDWYTVLAGALALAATTAHGAAFLAWKTEGPVRARSLRAAVWAWPLAALLWLAFCAATGAVNPALFRAYFHGAPLAFTALALAGLGAAWGAGRSGRDGLAFLGSSLWLLGMLAATAAAVFPVMLPSSGDPAHTLTAHNALAPEAGLRIALRWWFLGLPLALVYLGVLMRIHRGRVPLPEGGTGY
jgi:cytochrome d ubiquinol oxidase subunit II